jgi:hypothetical protein
LLFVSFQLARLCAFELKEEQNQDLELAVESAHRHLRQIVGVCALILFSSVGLPSLCPSALLVEKKKSDFDRDSRSASLGKRPRDCVSDVSSVRRAVTADDAGCGPVEPVMDTRDSNGGLHDSLASALARKTYGVLLLSTYSCITTAN